MGKSIKQSIKEFKQYWKNYVFQSLLATLTIFIAFIFLNIEKGSIIIAAIGASAFIVFAMPQNIMAKPRNLIGGHMVGILSGSLCALIPHLLYLHSIIIYSLAVGLSIFVMLVIDTEHPPASGTALSLAITGFSLKAVVIIIISAISLSLVHHFLKSYLRDLT